MLVGVASCNSFSAVNSFLQPAGSFGFDGFTHASIHLYPPMRLQVSCIAPAVAHELLCRSMKKNINPRHHQGEDLRSVR